MSAQSDELKSQQPASGFGKRKIASSAAWRTLEVGGNEVASFLFFIIMTRLLVPEQFGVVALAGSIVQVGQALIMQGMPDALIQREDLREQHIRSAFGAQLAIASALVLAIVILAWPLAWALRRPELPAVLLALAPILWLHALSAPMHALLRRQLSLKTIAARTLLGTVIGGAVAVWLAGQGLGLWALVAQQWLGQLVGFIVLCTVATGKPWQLSWDRSALAELASIARPIMFSNLVHTAARRLDIFALGLFLGNFEVGLYFLIIRMVSSVQLVTQYSIGEIGLVVLSRLQHDAERHRYALRQALKFTVLACGLCFGLLAIVADHLIPMVFGEAWQAAERPLQVLAILSTFGALVNIAGHVLVSGGSAKRAAVMTAALALTQLAVVFIAARFGLLPLVSAIGLVQLLAVGPAFWMVGQRFQVPFRTLLLDSAPIVFCYVVSMVGVSYIPTSASSWDGVFLAGLLFALTMLAAGTWAFRAQIGEIMRTRQR